jgi:hypothetical protein
MRATHGPDTTARYFSSGQGWAAAGASLNVCRSWTVSRLLRSTYFLGERRTLNVIHRRERANVANTPSKKGGQHAKHSVGCLVGRRATASIDRKLAKALVRLAPTDLTMTEIAFKDLPLRSYDYDADFPPVALRGRCLRSMRSTR